MFGFKIVSEKKLNELECYKNLYLVDERVTKRQWEIGRKQIEKAAMCIDNCIGFDSCHDIIGKTIWEIRKLHERYMARIERLKKELESCKRRCYSREQQIEDLQRKVHK